jgi:hypothetical protein
MKATLHKRLVRLEQDVQAHQATARPEPTGHIEMIRGWLRSWGVQQQPEESLAETLARALGMGPGELLHRLRELACG